MSFEGLLAISGIVLAVYAIAQPVQRRSISLFVPGWLVPFSLLLSAVVLFWREGASVFGYEFFSWSTFTLTVVSFFFPVIATSWAIALWHIARLTKSKDKRFRDFVLACLREGKFDELVRILERNYHRLAANCKPDTADLLFEVRFVQAMTRARTWIHLKLLTNNALLDLLPDHHHAVGRTLRELLFADNSPLRTSALLDEGGDETLHCTDEEQGLINRTFRNPQWYHRCRAGYPVLIAACEIIDSGALDTSYNRPDARYGARQGVATRTSCPVFLAEKTIAHALRASLEKSSTSSEDTHCDATDLWDLLNAVHEHSKYRPETWDEPFGYGDYPTPFGFLLGEILSDYEHICDEAWRKCGFGAEPPPDELGPVVHMWAYSVMFLAKDEGSVSPKFRLARLKSYLNMTLRHRHTEVNASDKKESQAAWTSMFIGGLKEASRVWKSDGEGLLTKAVNALDIAKQHVFKNHGWLRDELGLPPRPKPQA